MDIKLIEKILAHQDRAELEKTAVTAAGLGIGGAITPAAARQYFTTVTDQSTFLGRVSSVQVDAMEQDVDLFYVAPRQLQRVAEGSEPSTITGASNLGKRWALLAVQLFPSINFSTFIQRGEAIEPYLADKFATVFRNDLLDLGLNGLIGSGTPFLALNNGWVKCAIDAVATTGRDLGNSRSQRISHGAVTVAAFIVGEEVEGGTSTATGDIAVIGSGYLDLVNVVGTFASAEVMTGATSGAKATSSVLGAVGIAHIETMDAMIQAMEDKYLFESRTCFCMSVKNAIQWGKEMALKDGLNPFLITGNVPKYFGYEVIGIPGFPQNQFLFSDPKNLAFGMGSTIQRWRELQARKRCVDYTWNLYCDYIIINDEAVALSR